MSPLGLGQNIEATEMPIVFNKAIPGRRISVEDATRLYITPGLGSQTPRLSSKANEEC
jgi:hypothetical protein